MTRYKLPDALGGVEFEAEEEWGGCAGGRPEYRLPTGISILMPPGTPMERVPPLIPTEPEPGAYLIGGVLSVRFPNHPGHTQWLYGTIGHGYDETDSWESVWGDLGGPGITITRLVPAPPEVEMPWHDSEGVLVEVCNDDGKWYGVSVAERKGYALLAAARAAREASC